MKFYSHRNILLKDHLRDVGNLCKKYVEEVCPRLSEVGEKAGILHDLGKYTTYFQKYISGKMKRCDLCKHSRLSAYLSLLACKNLDINSKYIIYNSIISHHTHLRTINILKAEVDSVLKEQIEDLMKNKEIIWKELEELGIEIDLDEIDLNKDLEVGRIKKSLDLYFDCILVFSSLIDSDRKDAGNIFIEKREEFIPSNLVKEYLKYVCKNRKIDSLREELFSIVSKKIEEKVNEKIITITAPTGLGKTLSALYSALFLKEKLGYKRIIYALPYISIVDQTYETVEKLIQSYVTLKKLSTEEVAIKHHHLSILELEEDEELDRALILSDSWDSETVVTTFESLLRSIIGSRPSMLRRYHNIAKSILILDEVQAIPKEYWKDLREIVKKMTEYGTRIIFMTATLPKIFSGSEISFRPKIRRYVLKYLGEKIVDELLEDFISRYKGGAALIVANTIKRSQEIYNKLKKKMKLDGIKFGEVPDSENLIVYLSTSLIPKDRRWRIKEIKKLIEKDRNVVLVSTQVIEAGIDLDFLIAYRDLGPFDSIVQVAGRCNRNWDKEGSEVFIIKIIEDGCDAEKIYGKVLIDITEKILKGKEEIGENEIPEMLEMYYKELEKRAVTSSGLIEKIKNNDFDNIKDFSLIKDEPKIPIFLEFDDDALEAKENLKKILEENKNDYYFKKRNLKINRTKMENYVVNVWKSIVNEIKIKPDEFLKIPCISKNEVDYYYDRETGFRFMFEYDQLW